MPGQPDGDRRGVGGQPGWHHVRARRRLRQGRRAVPGRRPGQRGPADRLGGVYFGTGKGALYDLFYESFTSSPEISGTSRPTAPSWAPRRPSATSSSRRRPAGPCTRSSPGRTSATSPARPCGPYPVGGPVRSGPAFDNDMLYVGSDDGYLYAIDTATQRRRAGRTRPAAPSGPRSLVKSDAGLLRQPRQPGVRAARLA